MAVALSEIVNNQARFELVTGVPQVPQRETRRQASLAPRARRSAIRHMQDKTELEEGKRIGAGTGNGHVQEVTEEMEGLLVSGETKVHDSVELEAGPEEVVVFKDPDFQFVGELIDKKYGLPPAEPPPIDAISLDAIQDKLSNGHRDKPLPTFGAPTHWDQSE